MDTIIAEGFAEIQDGPKRGKVYCTDCGGSATYNVMGECFMCVADCMWHGTAKGQGFKSDMGEHHLSDLFPHLSDNGSGDAVAERFIGWNGEWSILFTYANGDEWLVEGFGLEASVRFGNGPEIPNPHDELS